MRGRIKNHNPTTASSPLEEFGTSKESAPFVEHHTVHPRSEGDAHASPRRKPGVSCSCSLPGATACRRNGKRCDPPARPFTSPPAATGEAQRNPWSPVHRSCSESPLRPTSSTTKRIPHKNPSSVPEAVLSNSTLEIDVAYRSNNCRESDTDPPSNSAAY